MHLMIFLFSWPLPGTHAVKSLRPEQMRHDCLVCSLSAVLRSLPAHPWSLHLAGLRHELQSTQRARVVIERPRRFWC